MVKGSYSFSEGPVFSVKHSNVGSQPSVSTVLENPKSSVDLCWYCANVVDIDTDM